MNKQKLAATFSPVTDGVELLKRGKNGSGVLYLRYAVMVEHPLLGRGNRSAVASLKRLMAKDVQSCRRTLGLEANLPVADREQLQMERIKRDREHVSHIPPDRLPLAIERKTAELKKTKDAAAQLLSEYARLAQYSMLAMGDMLQLRAEVWALTFKAERLASQISAAQEALKSHFKVTVYKCDANKGNLPEVT